MMYMQRREDFNMLWNIIVCTDNEISVPECL
jgi:hypothetical protein